MPGSDVLSIPKEGEYISSPKATSRPKCPFYGFIGMKMPILMFVDNNGNACGLEFSHKPCTMEMSGDKPNWSTCKRFNHEGLTSGLEKVMDTCSIFPSELKPPKDSGWTGVSLRGWYNLFVAKE